MTRKVVIYVDYENVLRTAQRAFPPADLAAKVAQLQSQYARDSSAEQGGEQSLRLTELAQAILHQSIAAPKIGSGNDLFIHEVRVYRGDPEGERPEVRRRTWTESDVPDQIWTTRPLVKLWPTERGESDRTKGEKGIDSSLAMDFVKAMRDHSCDVAVLFSGDRDVLSAVDYIKDNQHSDRVMPVIQLARWAPDKNIQLDHLEQNVIKRWKEAMTVGSIVHNCGNEHGLDVLSLGRDQHREIMGS